MMPIRRRLPGSTPCNRFGVALAQVTTTAAVARQMRTSPPSKSSGAWKDAAYKLSPTKTPAGIARRRDQVSTHVPTAASPLGPRNTSAPALAPMSNSKARVSVP